ncbi:MAG: DUF4358 domain-containing protein [Oscillospiraceae bacterium]|nr:DUF4358 domain-containing protein [Oscillospiraceae bacterium]
MNKIIAAAAAALCAVSLTACSGGNEPAPETSGVYTEISVSEEPASDAETEASAAESETEAEAEKSAVSCADIAAAVISSVELPSMAEVGADRVAMYLDLEVPEGCDFSMYICGSGGFADEVFVINAADMDIEAVKSAAEKRIESRIKDFEGYNPDEVDKLNDYFTKEKDGYFMYAVTCDNSVCESIFDEYVK